MRLRFIGADGSMGLKHGEVYPVKVVSKMGHIWVQMPFGAFSCPYSSPQTFAANWEAPNLDKKEI